MEVRNPKSGKPFTYLACPYTHFRPAVRKFRFQTANKVAAILFAQGEMVFSPISHTHPIKEQCPQDLGNWIGGFEVWESYDKAMLAIACGSLVVIAVPGWEKSRGVQGEMEIAKELDIPVSFVDGNGLVCDRPRLLDPSCDMGCSSGCGEIRKSGCRGLCHCCLSYLAKEVKQGRMTWEELDAKGITDSKSKNSGWHLQNRKKFLTAGVSA